MTVGQGTGVSRYPPPAVCIGNVQHLNWPAGSILLSAEVDAADIERR
jgi:hypothetical protein